MQVSVSMLRMLTKTAAGRVCDYKEVARQIGPMTVMAVSGGRVFPIYSEDSDNPVGARLPIDGTRRVDVVLDWTDTYTVRRVRMVTKGADRGADVVEFEQDDVYCDELANVVYSASCWK